MGLVAGERVAPAAARALMDGRDWRTGEQLVARKKALDPRGKVAARALVDALAQAAAETGMTVSEPGSPGPAASRSTPMALTGSGSTTSSAGSSARPRAEPYPDCGEGVGASGHRPPSPARWIVQIRRSACCSASSVGSIAGTGSVQQLIDQVWESPLSFAAPL
ncbi:hypothetical protein [Streptomyces sp. NBC_01546]|uniref:hypothetical protein n=1 Tax=Streptomyces sp. NBC_01546 TaxID=2975872 RepID=UPI00386616B5